MRIAIFLVVIFLLVVFAASRANLFWHEQSSFVPATSMPQPSMAAHPSKEGVLDCKTRTCLLAVPFVSQAPTGDWKDPRQQDGCEEAVSYMAWLWVKGETPPQAADAKEKELLKISDWEEKTYGSYHDTSASDTVERIFKGYFKYDKVEARSGISTQDIVDALEKGNLVIVPADGRLLDNPYYTAPGPERHNLVIKGFDPARHEFITNDNGTKRGENYRYKEDVLLAAIRDYPTGDHLSITKVEKAMIIVGLRE